MKKLLKNELIIIAGGFPTCSCHSSWFSWYKGEEAEDYGEELKGDDSSCKGCAKYCYEEKGLSVSYYNDDTVRCLLEVTRGDVENPGNRFTHYKNPRYPR